MFQRRFDGDHSPSRRQLLLADLPDEIAIPLRQDVLQRSDFDCQHVARAALESQATSLSPSCVIAVQSEDAGADLNWLDSLRRAGAPLAPVFLLVTPRLGTVVELLRHGAHNVLLWPNERARLAATLQAAFDAARLTAAERQVQEAARDLVCQLAPRERNVLDLLLAGATNKKVAAVLGIALRTVEDRRKKAFEKLRTRSLTEIFRLFQLAEGAPHQCYQGVLQRPDLVSSRGPHIRSGATVPADRRNDGD